MMENKTNKNYSIISKGHRNQQGLYFDQKTNYLLTTEHGPQGGDELNILNLNDEEFSKMTNEWSEGILKAFKSFPRFDWE